MASGSESQCRLVTWAQDDPLRGPLHRDVRRLPGRPQPPVPIFGRRSFDGLRASEVRLETTQPISSRPGVRASPPRACHWPTSADAAGRFQSWARRGLLRRRPGCGGPHRASGTSRAAGGSVEFCCLATRHAPQCVRQGAYRPARCAAAAAIPIFRTTSLVFFRNNAAGS